MGKQRRLKRQLWWALLFSLFGMYLVFRNIGQISWATFWTQINWSIVLLGIVILVIVWLAKAWRMYLLARGVGHQVKLWQLFQIYLATCFLSHVTPFNSGGTPLQILLLNRQGISAGKATAITLVDLVLNTLWFVILLPIAVISNLAILDKLKFTNLTVEKVGGALLVSLGLLGLCFWLWRSRVWRRSWLFKRLRSYLQLKGWLSRIRWEMGRFKEGWTLLMQYNRSIIWWAVIAGGIYWLFYLSLAPLCIWALGKSASFFKLIGWQLLFNFGQILIPTPGGSGGSEILLAYLFRDFTGPARIGAFVLLWKSYTFFSTLILGGFCFLKLTSGLKMGPIGPKPKV